MNLGMLVLLVALLSLGGFRLARARALATVGGDVKSLHSLPGYYGWYAALWCGIPGLLVAAVWVLVSSWGLDQLTLAAAPTELTGENEARLELFLNDVKNLARGDIASKGADETVAAAAATTASCATRG